MINKIHKIEMFFILQSHFQTTQISTLCKRCVKQFDPMRGRIFSPAGYLCLQAMMASVSDSSAYPSPSPNPAQLQTTYFRGMIPKQPLQGIIPSHPSLYIHRQQAHCKVYPIIHSPTLVVCETNNTTHMYNFDVLICLFFEYFLQRFKFLLF